MPLFPHCNRSVARPMHPILKGFSADRRLTSTMTAEEKTLWTQAIEVLWQNRVTTEVAVVSPTVEQDGEGGPVEEFVHAPVYGAS